MQVGAGGQAVLKILRLDSIGPIELPKANEGSRGAGEKGGISTNIEKIVGAKREK